VSFYHHTRGFVRHYDFAEGTFDDFFVCFIRGEVDFGDYFDNLVPWWGRGGEANVVCLTHEQMIADPRDAVSRVARFLGGQAARSSRDPKVLRRIVEHTGFEMMSRDQERWSSRRPDSMPPFIRKGIVGDWQSHFDGR